MEVHHHPDLNHKRKNFKEYFLEFLMIFLAVTMGFFAEDIRERLANHSKEREYMSQLVGDLKEDTTECSMSNISSVVTVNTRTEHYCDTLINILSKNDPTRAEVVAAYYMYHVIMFDWFTVYFKDATWSELRNNSGFSNIHNSAVVREINEYYKWGAIMNDYKDEFKQRYSAISYNEGRKVFDQRMEQVMLDSIDNKGYFIVHEPPDSIIQYISSNMHIQFVHNDAETILGLCNDLRFYKSLLALYKRMIKNQGERAEKLIQLIEKQYHLKDE